MRSLSSKHSPQHTHNNIWTHSSKVPTGGMSTWLAAPAAANSAVMAAVLAVAMAMCGVSSGLSWIAECSERAGGAIYSRRCPLARSTVASALGACRGGRRKGGGRRMRSPRQSTWSAGRGQCGWRPSARVFRHQMVCKSQSRPRRSKRCERGAAALCPEGRVGAPWPRGNGAWRTPTATSAFLSFFRRVLDVALTQIKKN